MTIVINGSTGITDVNGTAAAPAITGTDTDSGMYFGTNIVALATAGTNAVYVDASQNVGLGTTSPNQKLQVNNTAASSSFALFTNSTTGSTASDGTYFGVNSSGFAYAWNQENTAMLFGTNNGERMRITATGDIGIGTDSPNTKLQVYKAAASAFTGTSPGALLLTDSTNTTNYFTSIDFNTTTSPSVPFARIGMGYTASGSTLNFGTSNSYASGITNTAMTIDPVGNVLVGTTNTSLTAGVGAKFISSATEPYISYVINSAGGSSYHLYNTNATNNGYRFYVTTNGGIVNYSANNINLSDERTKTDIQNSGNYLAKICAIPVRTFKYKDQADDLLNLGVIAQEVESIAPELVDVSGFGETPEDGIPLKSIYQTDLQYALMKCIQEQQALITSLTARIEALEAKWTTS